MTAVLETHALSKSFGGFRAIADVSLSLERGVRQALIGPNGAGKTTLINLLTGNLAPTSGRVWMAGRDVTSLSPRRRVGLGLARTFQINQLFGPLTPLQTVALAIVERTGVSWNPWVRLDAMAAVAGEAMRRLGDLGLDDVADAPTDTLPYGRQRLLEVCTALAGEPRVLLLDEPAAGVPHGESGEILAVIDRLPRDVTVLLIEHDMDLVFRFAERISVLVGGSLLVEGDPDAVARDERVRAVYLGEGAVEAVADG